MIEEVAVGRRLREFPLWSCILYLQLGIVLPLLLHKVLLNLLLVLKGLMELEEAFFAFLEGFLDKGELLQFLAALHKGLFFQKQVLLMEDCGLFQIILTQQNPTTLVFGLILIRKLHGRDFLIINPTLVLVLDDDIGSGPDIEVEFDGVSHFGVDFLHHLHSLELMLVHGLIAERAPLPAPLLLKCQILKNTRPAEDVSALGDLGDHHLLKVFHADWALDIFSIHDIGSGVEDHLDDVFPVDNLVGVVDVQNIVLLAPHDELQLRLDHLVPAEMPQNTILKLSPSSVATVLLGLIGLEHRFIIIELKAE